MQSLAVRFDAPFPFTCTPARASGSTSTEKA
jgi:hypothetical protein